MLEPKLEIKDEPTEVNFDVHNPDIDSSDTANNLLNIKSEALNDPLQDNVNDPLHDNAFNEESNLEEGDTQNNEEEEEEDDDDDDDINIIINTAKPGAVSTSTAYKLSTLQKQTSADATTPASSKPGLAPAISIPEDISTSVTPTVDYSMTVMAEEDKPWKKPGADITDFFNYGFTEGSWVGYCERQKDLRQKYGTSLSRAVIPNPLAQTNKLKSTKSSMHVIGTINVIGEKVPQFNSSVGNAIPTLGQPNQTKTLTPDIFNQPPPGFMPPGMPFSMPPPGAFLPPGIPFTPGVPPPFGVMPPNMMMPSTMMPPPPEMPHSESGNMPINMPINMPSSIETDVKPSPLQSHFHPEEYSSYTNSADRSPSPNAAKRLNDWDRDSHDGNSSGDDLNYKKRSKRSETSHRRDSRKQKRSHSKTRHTSKHKRRRDSSRSPERY